MRSGMVWLLASAAALCTAVACSEDDDSPVTSTGLPNQPGAAGSSSTVTPTPAPVTPAPTGSQGGSEGPGVTQQMPGANNGGVAAGTADAGTDDPEPAADAGSSEPAADAAPPVEPPPVEPPPVEPPPVEPPPADAVDFSEVFPILVASCGNCHGANAPGNRPRFAQAGNEAASETAALAPSQGTTVAQRIIVRALQERDMPPACNGGALGTGACLDQAEADLLQAWAGSLQP